MGYNARGSGSAKIREGVDLDALKKLLDESNNSNVEFGFFKSYGREDYIDLNHENKKWYAEEVEEFLELLVPYIINGQFTFIGDDDEQWQYVFDSGKWKEFTGEVIFLSPDMPTYKQLWEMFVAYVTNDSEGVADRDYTTRCLEQCGCNETFRKTLGLDFPVEGGEE